jgi:protocatechuate 3,4-dioxygenase beta subunit
MAQAPAVAPAEAPSPFAAISGIVLNDATGTPLHRVAITLSTMDATPLEALTFSESNGAFGFTAIPPGKYLVYAHLDGFQSARFGASTSSRPPEVLKLAAGDIRYGITFRLHPLGSISGVVFGADGDPLPNAQVGLLKSTWERLKPAYGYRYSASTDERGRYRFANVIPGQYLVMATQQFMPAVLVQPEAAAGQDASQKMYAVQFYPDANRLSSAAPVEVTDGEDVEDIDFHLTALAVAGLHGKVAVPNGVPNPVPNSIPDESPRTPRERRLGPAFGTPPGAPAQIRVYPQDLPNSLDHGMGAAAFPPGYEFELANLIPGPYVIEATISAEGRDYRAIERIELPAGGQDLTLHPDRAIDLAGRVDLDGGGERPAGGFRVALIPGGYPPGRSRIETEVHADGTFVVPNVVPGIWDIHVRPVPPGGYVKAMRLGEQDVLTEDMTIEPGTREQLRIVVGTRGAVVTGTVMVPSGLARSGRARVLLAPCGRYVHVLSFYKLAPSDDYGRFEIKGVTPGQYKLYAFEELDPAAYEDPNFLPPFASLSEAFDVAEGARVDRQTQLIPAGSPAVARN